MTQARNVLRKASAPAEGDGGSLLSPVNYDDDARSLHSRSDQDTDSEDDELQMNARNSRELRAHDRIMLMEEEEVENLVTKTRKSKAPADTGSTFLNPFSLFGRNNRAHDESANTSTEDLSEKKRIRRSRRREKRERLKEQAEHGEDGELMYEMEEGGMKDGSSTGESSEDSEEMDQNRLNVITKAKADRKRSRRRWILIHTIIVAVFAVFVLVAWKLTSDRKRMAVASQVFSNGTALFGPTTVIISLDGFRPDFLQRGLTPRLNAFIREGVSPKYMLPSFPSVTFPVSSYVPLAFLFSLNLDPEIKFANSPSLLLLRITIPLQPVSTRRVTASSATPSSTPPSTETFSTPTQPAASTPSGGWASRSGSLRRSKACERLFTCGPEARPTS